MPDVASPPVIDLSAQGVGPLDPAVVATIDRACVDIGFFVVTGHGLEDELDRLLVLGRAFFARPQTEKETIGRDGGFGYVPHVSTATDEALAAGRASTGTEYLDLPVGRNDGDPSAPSATVPGRLDGFQETIERYQAGAVDLSRRLLAAMATALGSEAHYFDRYLTEPDCKLRFLRYPPVEPGPDGALPVPTTPHTDYGALTLLATDGVPGLEVRPVDRGWVPVDAPAGSLVVNLGDLLARWTNDRYRSTPHRVVGPPRGERYSIPLFVNPSHDTVVETIPSCISAEHPLHYPPVTAGDFVTERRESPAEPYVDPAEGPTRRLDV